MRTNRKNLAATLVVVLISISSCFAALLHNVGQENSPEETAKQFYAAFKRGDRRAALKLATRAVVREVFENNAKKADWHFTDCSEPKVKTHGDITCFYIFQGGGIGMFMRKQADGSYRIVSTYYMTED